MAEPKNSSARHVRLSAPREQKHQYLAFGLGGDAFAMEIVYVKEVIQYSELTEVPLMPPFIRGVINLRGAMVPVIDLSVRLGRGPTQIARRNCVVILEVPNGVDTVVVGVIVENVSEVLDLAASDIDPTPSFGGSIHSEFLKGVGKVGERFVMLLDVKHLLSIAEFSILANDPVAEGGSQ